MHSLNYFGLAMAASLSMVLSANLPTKAEILGRQALAPSGPDCGNTPTTRGQWCPNFDINTDYDLVAPMTGFAYDLRISRKACAPDGSNAKNCTLINGQYPGPTLRAKWGDILRVIVHNDLPDNGTSIHWHGVRQLHTNPQDGANGITECPIASGSTKTYEFRATQHGTSWYHSHHSVQYSEGIVGQIIFDGPATENYDLDLGALPLSDWYYGSAWVYDERVLNAGAPPQNDNVLVNGTMKSASGTGQYNIVTVQKGNSYRLRIINQATDHIFTFSMDNHPFDVIATDFIPTVPHRNLTQITINIGQRYDIVFTTKQAVDNYWMRVDPGCPLGGTARIYSSGIVVGGILRYKGAPSANPISTSFPLTHSCTDEPSTPFWPRTIPSATFSSGALAVSFPGAVTRNGHNYLVWEINTSSMQVDWKIPTLEYVREGRDDFPAQENLYRLNGTDSTWTYWVIQFAGGFALPHPIHLHGHDFWVLGSGSGNFDGTTAGLNFTSPRRRDTALLPPGGFLVIAFVTDNPGAWLMHCHIGWHVSGGLSVQFLEREKEIVSSLSPQNQFDAFKQGCTEWNNAPHLYTEDDSGL